MKGLSADVEDRFAALDFLLKPDRARFYLDAFSLKVKDAAFGRHIRDALRWPEPRIFVEARERAAA